jgi:hypothetical protein
LSSPLSISNSLERPPPIPPERAPRPKTGPAEAALALVLSERITNLNQTRETVTILSWRLLWSVTLLRPRPTPIRVSLKRLTTK